MANEDVLYRSDSHDTIVRVGGAWNAYDALDTLGLTLPESRSRRLTRGICETCAGELRALARA
jgi:hypothetical protein